MSKQQTTQSGVPGKAGDHEPALGIGGRTSGQQGSSPSHETQQETGGSGGDGLTRNQSGETVNAPAGRPAGEPAPEAQDSAMTRQGPGVKDTGGEQAGGTGTGLGTPETGGNQSPEDLERGK